MADLSFTLRRDDGGAYLRDTYFLRGVDAAALAANLDVQADVAAVLTTQIDLRVDVDVAADVGADLGTVVALAADAQDQADIAGTLSDYIVPRPIAHASREYSEFFRGPTSGFTYYFGTVDAYLSGAWHTANIVDFSEPQDNAPTDFGIMEGGGFTVKLASTADSPIDLPAIAAAVIDQEFELELRTQLLDDTGVPIDVLTHVRRAVVKKALQRRNVLELTLADVDRTALERVYPFEAFTVEDFPELFSDHVGRLITEGVGTVLRVPLIYISNAGPFIYAGPKVLSAPGMLLTVYRGEAEGQGAIVDASEYTAGTATGAVSGSIVNTVEFVNEQINTTGTPYILEADYLLPGSRLPADELERILGRYGISAEVGSFTAAAAYDAVAGFLVDCLYGAEGGRTGTAIVEDLLRVARAWLVQSDASEWALRQDRPQIPVLEFDTAADEADVSEYGAETIPKTITVQFAPRRAGTEDYARSLQRHTAASSGEFVFKSPYMRDYAVGDRMASYLEAKLTTLKRAVASLYGTQLTDGALIYLSDATHFGATKKQMILDGMSRPADRNDAQLREYVAALYEYSPGALPSDASNGYGPDYSFTDPLAPTIKTPLAAGTTTTLVDGSVEAAQLIQLTPPAVNWAKLTVMITDTTNGVENPGQALFNALTGYYETTIGGLPPARTMEARAWATNADGRDGVVTAPVTFTSATNANVPAAPASIVLSQTHSRQVDVAWPAVVPPAGAPSIDYYVAEYQIFSGAWTQFYQGKDLGGHIVGLADGLQIGARVKAVNTIGTVGSLRTSVVPLLTDSKIDDGYIVSSGVSGTSIADGSINQGRQSSSTQSQSGNVTAGNVVSIGGGSAAAYSFCPGLALGNSGSRIGTLGLLLTPAATQFSFYIQNNDPATQPYDAEWRQVST